MSKPDNNNQNNKKRRSSFSISRSSSSSNDDKSLISRTSSRSTSFRRQSSLVDFVANNPPELAIAKQKTNQEKALETYEAVQAEFIETERSHQASLEKFKKILADFKRDNGNQLSSAEKIELDKMLAVFETCIHVSGMILNQATSGQKLQDIFLNEEIFPILKNTLTSATAFQARTVTERIYNDDKNGLIRKIERYKMNKEPNDAEATPSYLIKITQRAPRYSLLLKEANKQLKEANPEKAEDPKIQTAIFRANELGTEANINVAKKEAMEAARALGRSEKEIFWIKNDLKLDSNQFSKFAGALEKATHENDRKLAWQVALSHQFIPKAHQVIIEKETETTTKRQDSSQEKIDVITNKTASGQNVATDAIDYIGDAYDLAATYKKAIQIKNKNPNALTATFPLILSEQGIFAQMLNLVGQDTSRQGMEIRKTLWQHLGTHTCLKIGQEEFRVVSLDQMDDKAMKKFLKEEQMARNLGSKAKTVLILEGDKSIISQQGTSYDYAIYNKMQKFIAIAKKIGATDVIKDLTKQDGQLQLMRLEKNNIENQKKFDARLRGTTLKTIEENVNKAGELSQLAQEIVTKHDNSKQNFISRVLHKR